MAQTDVYEYIAVQAINHGNVVAYQPGDPVPADNVKEQGYEVGSQVVLRKDYKPDSGAVQGTDAIGVRGELPAHLLKGSDKPAEPLGEDASTDTGAKSRKAATTK